MNRTWKRIDICREDLHLSLILSGGQSFRWKSPEPDKWIGVFRNRVWILLQKDNHLLYRCFDQTSKSEVFEENKGLKQDSDEETKEMLKSYFRLDVDLRILYQTWAEADPHFRNTVSNLYGIRILNQEVIENIFSFICSSNNNIKRISSMIETLCQLYGDPIVKLNGETFKGFPKLERLTEDSVEHDLRKAGFGYRAKYIHRSACLIQDLGGSQWLKNLKSYQYQDAKKELMKLPGVGAKVADCICLMSLGHFEAVPVDTHIFQVSVKKYLPHLKNNKSFTKKVYNEIAEHYRSLHGSYAGWANTVLFCADLKIMKTSSINEKVKDGGNDFR